MRKPRLGIAWTILLVGLFAATAAAAPSEAEIYKTKYPWNISIGGGWRDFEGDELIKDAAFVSCQFEYDMPTRWTFMGVLGYYPKLAGKPGTDWTTGQRTNRLREDSGVDSTTAVTLTVEGLYHLRSNAEAIDPYMVASIGLTHFFDDFSGVSAMDPNVTAGIGFLYHLSRQWSLRVDGRVLLTFSDETQASSYLTFGIVHKVSL